MYNNAHTLWWLSEHLDNNPTSSAQPPVRKKLEYEPCLPARLPSSGFLQREANSLAPKAIIKQLRRSPTPPGSEPQSPSLDGTSVANSPSMEQEPKSPRERKDSVWSTISSTVNASRKLSKGKGPAKQWKVEPYQIFSAVEKRDIMFLMEVRDRDFEMLLRKSGDVTPLLHAMRIGNQDVAVTLLGAFSRYINQLQDEEMALPRTKTRLKALRTNLKLAIDFGLQTQQSDLIASFLQTLIMSEGDKWVSQQAATISGLLREGNKSKPVSNAQSTVKRFATKQLGKADAIAALEDYIANATADLIMIGAWYCAMSTIEAEPIPTYYFARDDRVYKAFVDRLDQYKHAINRTCTRRLKWQMRVLRTVIEGRNTNYRSKVQTLVEEFDEGSGV
ncbi:hypothetical protein BDY19DRAFT_927701 [Irpex rosettiformis]|uniref:Uncharacterized protein n=1 Tax=Irpex rosettiformis TaxID=378272 RepID=A0ACB8UCS2_9APHY|nr:hypothetical protein BDY19DRAFT_927701 [Irpex rosettiformis]